MIYDQDVKERCRRAALYIIEENTTVRKAASKLGISKSTVHKDVTERLRYSEPSLYRQVEEVLLRNKNERHLRGGEATRLKYLNKRSKEE